MGPGVPPQMASSYLVISGRKNLSLVLGGHLWSVLRNPTSMLLTCSELALLAVPVQKITKARPFDAHLSEMSSIHQQMM